MSGKAKKIIRSAVSAVFWIALWWAFSLIVGKTVLLPSPKETFSALFVLLKSGDFYLSCLMTVARIAAGLICGVIFGTLSGALSYRFETFSALISPLDAVIKATPVASFIILALVWLTKGTIPSFTSFLIVSPIISSSVKSSLMSLDTKTLEAMKLFKLPLGKRIKYVYIPSCKIRYISSIEVALGLAWKSGISAEVLCTPKYSMGKAIFDSKIYLETDTLFAWTLAVIVFSLLLELAVRSLSGIGKKREVRKNEA